MPEGKKDSPHGNQPYGSPTQRDILGGVSLPDYTKRHKEMQGPGIFDLPSETTIITEPLIPEKKKTLTFRKGAPYYTIEQPVPRTPLEAQDRKAGELIFKEGLDLHEDNIVWSKESQGWITYAKPEHKTTLFGQFVKALIPILDEEGEPITDKEGKIVKRTVFISLNDRSGLESDRDKLE